jgi:predicted Zn-dependent protease
MRQGAVYGTKAARRALGRALAAGLAASIALPPLPASADVIPGASSVSIARDAEIEALVQDYARPIFKAAGLRTGSIQIFLVPDQTFNAFVANANSMFLNVGTLITSETPNEVIGVIAHETGHLVAGDLARLRQRINDAKSTALIAGLIGVGAAIAGAASGVNALSQAGSGIVMGGMQIAQRTILSYQRGQEAAADRAAVSFLEETGQSGAGLLATLNRLANQMLLTSRQLDPYLQSHPLPQERITALEELVKAGKSYGQKDPPELQRRHDLARAKLVGFTWAPDRVARKYPATDTSLPARYARAISAYRHGTLDPAIKQIDGLIASDPTDAYFQELKGQAYLEGGKPKEAVEPLRKAVSLAPSSGLLRILFGQALVATDNPALVDEAIKNLTIGLQADPDVPIGYRQLARAYALKNDIPMAELATAQGFFVDGKIEDAQGHAARAQAKLKAGSPAWLRADDIVSYKPPKSP